MPERSRKRPRDLNTLAAAIVADATEEEQRAPELTEEPESAKDPAAVALGRKGGLKGGKARAANMTPEERSKAAKKAAKVRWSKREH